MLCGLIILDTLQCEMDRRFGDADITKVELLLIIPSCVVAPRWRHKREELEDRIKAAAKTYAIDMGTHEVRFATELKLWIDYW